jgi:protein O-mannosyl-transferase
MKRRKRPTSLARSSEPRPDAVAAVRTFGPKDWLFVVALLAALLLVYQPAWQGRLIWDDDVHVTSPELQSWHGLYRIWFEVGATLQYYPLLHSAFWIEHKLWGDATLGYHLTNILLHATAAILVALVLRRLKIPGAYLAAAIFALHPIQVESVAWITEQKNTLSAVFYLGAMLVYLHFDQTRKVSLYCWALGLFVLGVLSKTIIATLPGALLVIFWWQRGRLSWKNDVLPLVPFFLLGAGGGMITAWWELQINNCVGPDFALTLVERCLIAGRTAWFLLWKLLWPMQLTFTYPRWQISAGIWWQYAFPLGAVAMLAVLWSIRRRARAPLAAALFFGGTLFPMLGFFNLYTFLYSFVANHYQYLACLGIITLVAAGTALLLNRWGLWGRPGGYALCLVPLAILAGLTWQQSKMYSDIETLYRTTIAENPDCWMAYNNLGNILGDRGETGEAMSAFQKALEIKPDYADAHRNLGSLLARVGRFDEAIAHFQKALETRPDFADAHNGLGIALAGRGRFDEAIPHFEKALELKPNQAVVYNNLGNALTSCGRTEEAINHFQRALEIKPDYAEAYANLGNALANRGRIDEAIAQFSKALEFKPDFAGVRRNLGIAQSQREEIRKTLAGRRESLRARPDDVTLLNETAWMLATNPNASIRNGVEAVELAQRAVRLSKEQEPAVLGTLAAAYAEAGRFAEAVQTARKALELATQQNKKPLSQSVEAKIRLYEAAIPFRETQQPAPPNSAPP